MRDTGPVQRALQACREGDLDTLEMLDMQAYGGWSLVVDNKGATGVHHAARSGSVAVLQWLINDQGCPAAGSSDVGATPALDAAAAGKQDALCWLLENTACSLEDRDDSGATCLHLAARYGHLDIVKWLVTTFDLPVTLTSKTGATALHFAAETGKLDTVKFLVERDTSILDVQTETGLTASYLSAQEGHLETLRYLVEEGGAKVKLTAFDGMTCLHAAAQMDRLDCVSWLVVTGKIPIDECDFDGASALHFAAAKGHMRVVHWLLMHGAKFTQDYLGGTPLHDAAEHGQLKCVRTLLRFGCDPSLRDNNGMTAADLAENGWHRDCAATLRRRIAKGVGGMARQRPSIHAYFNPDYVDMTNGHLGSGLDGCSDYVDMDSGSETSSTYVVHTDLSRSSRSSEPDYHFMQQFWGRLPPGTRFSIPPPPSAPPPAPPSSRRQEDADAVSSQSTSSSQSETAADYQNLHASEVASLRHLHAALAPAYHHALLHHHHQQHHHEGSPLYGRVRKAPSLTEITERDSEAGSRPPSLDILDRRDADAGNKAASTPQRPLPSSAPVTPQHAPPPPPPPLPTATFTPPTNAARWKKMAYASLPNVSMSGDAARFLLRPTVKDNTSTKTIANGDLIAELKAANGKASLKRAKRQSQPSEVASEQGPDAENAEPKLFWAHLQRKSSNPPSEAGSRRSSIQLREEFDPQNFLDKVSEASEQSMPQWKKVLLARQMAQRAQAEADEKQKIEEQERKYKHLPIWKKALIEKKEKEAMERKAKQQKEEEKQARVEKEPKGEVKTEAQINLRKTKINIEELENKRETSNKVLAPWQMEVKKKKELNVFEDGYV